MNSISRLRYARHVIRSHLGAIEVARRGAPGLRFDLFGRALGWFLLSRGYSGGGEYLLTPVSSVRYFEFDFVNRCLPNSSGHYLDLSSPRLFSLYQASRNRSSRLLVLNPDPQDMAQTVGISRRLGCRNLHGVVAGVEVLAGMESQFDVAWSISVVEHIAGSYDDRDAIRWLFRSLRPGGRLIVTVPVDRRAWDEYRDRTYYGQTGSDASRGKYFFQRFYDSSAIQERLIDPIGKAPECVEWYGERVAGHFHNYINHWQREGFTATVNDAFEFSRSYIGYDSWEAMPGCGVCGLLFVR